MSGPMHAILLFICPTVEWPITLDSNWRDRGKNTQLRHVKIPVTAAKVTKNPVFFYHNRVQSKPRVRKLTIFTRGIDTAWVNMKLKVFLMKHWKIYRYVTYLTWFYLVNSAGSIILQKNSLIKNRYMCESEGTIDEAY